MRTRLRHLWEVLTTGYWFVPTLMIVVAIVAAFVLLYIDHHLIGRRVGWLYAGGSDGAKTMLSTIAGSVITVAGVVFSITIAALTQASSQFGPRLLRNFMRDTSNQVVLGTFVATFVYCLLILRMIHGEIADGVGFVPHASVTVAVLLASASIGVLIYFIHHVSISLQAPSVVAAVLHDLEETIDRLPDDQEGTGVIVAAGDGLPSTFDTDARPVVATKQGYIQVVDYEGLMDLVKGADLVVRLSYRPGDYVIEGTPLLFVWPAERCDNAALSSPVNGAFICGRNPTTEQDLEHALRQMVEVAVRALSPGINDPFTAINCIDALGSAVCRIARRGLGGPVRYDQQGKLRMVAPVTTFTGVVDLAFNQIRQYGRGSAPVSIRLLEVIRLCAGQMANDEQRRSLLRHARMVYEDSQETVPQQQDRNDLRERWEAVEQALRAQHPCPTAQTPPTTE